MSGSVIDRTRRLLTDPETKGPTLTALTLGALAVGVAGGAVAAGRALGAQWWLVPLTSSHP